MLLRSRPPFPRIALFAATLLVSGAIRAADPAPDPAVTTFGTLNPKAPTELATFSFLIGKWTGTQTYVDSEGKSNEVALEWIGRYVLDGMAIADEGRSVIPGGSEVATLGMSLRYFDPVSKTWTIEFLNFYQSFLRKQVNAAVGEVLQEGNRVTIMQAGPAGPAREVYTIVDPDHVRYSMDFTQPDGQTWDEGVVTIQLERSDADEP